MNRPKDVSNQNSKGSLEEVNNCTCLNRTPYDHNLNKPLRSDNSCQCTLKKKKTTPKAKQTKSLSVAQTQTVDDAESSSDTEGLLSLMRGKSRVSSTSKTSQSSGRLLKVRNRVYSGEDVDQDRTFVCKPGCPGARKFKNYGGYTPSETEDDLCSNVCEYDRPYEHLNKIDQISKPPALKTKWGLKIPSTTEIEYYMFRSSRENTCINQCPNIPPSRAVNNRYSNDSMAEMDFRRDDSPLRDGYASWRNISRRNSPDETPMQGNFSQNSFGRNQEPRSGYQGGNFDEAPDSRRPSTRHSGICDNPDCPWQVSNSPGQRQEGFPSRRRSNDNYSEPARPYRNGEDMSFPRSRRMQSNEDMSQMRRNRGDDFDPNSQYRQRRFQESDPRYREDRRGHDRKYCLNSQCPFNREQWNDDRMNQDYEGRSRNQNDDRSRYQQYSNTNQRGADEHHYCPNPECPFNRTNNRRYHSVEDLSSFAENDGRNTRPDVTWREENEMDNGSHTNVLSQCVCLSPPPTGDPKTPEKSQVLGNF